MSEIFNLNCKYYVFRSRNWPYDYLFSAKNIISYFEFVSFPDDLFSRSCSVLSVMYFN